jgi:ADP-heptose:LPS heptosyltransferase
VILAYRALGLGDFLTGIPALRALARAFPEQRHVLAAPAALAPLAALTGAVDEVVDTAPLGPAPPGAEVAVNLHGRGPQSHAVLRASRPGRLIAFGCDGVEWREDEHEVARWCRLLRRSGIAADVDDLDLAPPPVPSPAPGATILHPGAASRARRWPAERFAAIVAAELAGGRDVVVTGSAAERELAAAVAAGGEATAAGGEATAAGGEPRVAVMAGDTDLVTLAALVAHAGRVVCGDTGVAHLATAFGTPSVVLFGPTPPSQWGPPPDRPQHQALWAGGRGDPHARTPDHGLLEITVQDVLEALERAPARAGALPEGPTASLWSA